MNEQLQEAQDHALEEFLVAIRDLAGFARQREIPAELRALVFDGSAGVYEQLDDVGAPARSFAVINPVEATAYINFGGGQAREGSAIPVPPRSALVMPIATPGHVMLGVDQTDLGEDEATIYRLRFHSVQPFFLGALG